MAIGLAFDTGHARPSVIELFVDLVRDWALRDNELDRHILLCLCTLLDMSSVYWNASRYPGNHNCYQAVSVCNPRVATSIRSGCFCGAKPSSVATQTVDRNDA